ncbi:MAG: hypothetical protein ASUL_08554 [Candidatus Aramenus sulfurataquae]|jgi:hypothetical protein|uniref:Uncharacterized protein n=1 Tax=Candidatus Aramenus sulfurataquae TaxID=1326980 RepID=W7KHC6_9CREN|nr:MAG: hypothetical protein ASUL_08554 [Candidatus Aramenus sulfurataquae]
MIAYSIYQTLPAGRKPELTPSTEDIQRVQLSVDITHEQHDAELQAPILDTAIPEFYDYNRFNIYNGLWKYYVANGPSNFSPLA